MEIKNAFDFFILTVFFVPFGLGIGFIGGIYFISLGFKEGVVLSKDQLLSDIPNMTGLQKLISGIFVILFAAWFMFVKGEFFRYLDGARAYLGS